ncbi:MAG: ATP synthase F0 subunit C [Rubrobacteraceae bacterium]|nr:ATP synthase F0 subunit C [Rubrobacteraceae bacterium]
MDVVALFEVTQALALLQVQGDVEAGLKLVGDGLKLVGVGVAAGTAVIGPGAGMGYLIGQTIASIHRQPEAFEQTRTLMFLGIGLVEAFALYGIVFALLIAFVLA